VVVDMIKRFIRVGRLGFRGNDLGLTNVDKFDSVDPVISINDAN
jgi:hypothetical protein